MPWLKMAFKTNQQVFAEVDLENRPVVVGGRVRIRYKLSDPREYKAYAGNLVVIPGELPAPDQAAVATEAPALARRTTIRVERTAEIPETAPAGTILAFTDGACTGNPGPAGLGVVLLAGEHRKLLREYLGEGTNNIGELAAIGRALTAIKQTQRPVRIYTDSSYAIGVLAQGWKAKANQELISSILTRAAEFADLALIKVKGHAGHALNELADQLACDAVALREKGLVVVEAEQRTALAAEPTEFAGDPNDRTKPEPIKQRATEAAPHTTAPAIAMPAHADGKRPPLIIHTDGACSGNPGPAGLGFVIVDGDGTREGNAYLGIGTNNIAELTAILRALDDLDVQRPTRLHTDSTYAIGVLTKGWKAKANQELVASIRARIAAFDDLRFIKVKGHAGDPLNERADSLARAALDLPL